VVVFRLAGAILFEVVLVVVGATAKEAVTVTGSEAIQDESKLGFRIEVAELLRLLLL
jgi:hypothetical protein